MKTVPVRDLRNDHAAVLRRVEAGEVLGSLPGIAADLTPELPAEREEWDERDDGDPFEAPEQTGVVRATRPARSTTSSPRPPSPTA